MFWFKTPHFYIYLFMCMYAKVDCLLYKIMNSPFFEVLP